MVCPTTLVFLSHFTIPVCNYIMWSMCSLKVNIAVFNWSDFTHNCVILSATFGIHFVWISRLISEFVLKINQHCVLNIEVQKWNNLEHVHLFWCNEIVEICIAADNDGNKTSPVNIQCEELKTFLFVCVSAEKYWPFLCSIIWNAFIT
jgi:hypothetical protein